MKNVKYILFILLGSYTGFLMSRHLAFKRIVEVTDEKSKYFCLFKFANEWITMKQNGKDISAYFKNKGYYSIAVYGMGDLGERLADEMKNTDINVKYAIDRGRNGSYAGIEIKNMDSELPEVDAVIVTPVYNFCEIERDLKETFKCPIVSLEEILLQV